VRRVVLLPPVDPDPAETARRDVELVAAWEHGVAGVAGWSEDGWKALHIAAEHPEVERLVLLATPVREEAAVPPVETRTLLLFGMGDELTGSKAARWWKKQIPHARVEMSPGLGHDLLAARWPRVLSHLGARHAAVAALP
jgi:pimeloyl-ACP methyl ester carboxylesterase